MPAGKKQPSPKPKPQLETNWQAELERDRMIALRKMMRNPFGGPGAASASDVSAAGNAGQNNTNEMQSAFEKQQTAAMNASQQSQLSGQPTDQGDFGDDLSMTDDGDAEPGARESKSSGGRVRSGAAKTAQSAGRGLETAGKGARTVGKGVETGAKAAEAGGKAIGQATSAAGTALSSGGSAMMNAGKALSSTTVGAIAGVPLMLAGGGMAAGGAGMKAGGKGIAAGSKAVGAAGRSAGRGMQSAGKSMGGLGSKLNNSLELPKGPTLGDAKQAVKGELTSVAKGAASGQMLSDSMGVTSATEMLQATASGDPAKMAALAFRDGVVSPCIRTEMWADYTFISWFLLNLYWIASIGGATGTAPLQSLDKMLLIFADVIVVMLILIIITLILFTVCALDSSCGVQMVGMIFSDLGI